MRQEVTLFVGMFTTLLAIINRLEALPVFLKLLDGKSEEEHRRVARLSCTYAMLLAFFFLFFGKFIMWIFGVPLSMVRIVGGNILLRIGFELFSPSSPSGIHCRAWTSTAKRGRGFCSSCHADHVWTRSNRYRLGMVSLVKHSEFEVISAVAMCMAIVATMFVTYLFLPYAKKVLNRIGPRGIDAATCIIGFFVSIIGMGLIFHGVVEANSNLWDNGKLVKTKNQFPQDERLKAEYEDGNARRNMPSARFFNIGKLCFRLASMLVWPLLRGCQRWDLLHLAWGVARTMTSSHAAARSRRSA